MDYRPPAPAAPPTSLGRILQNLKQELRAQSDTPSLEARLVLAHALHRPPTWVLAHPEYRPSAAERRVVAEIMERLQEGEPLPVLLGRWEFFGLTFEVGPEVLIPRPETELLVETALTWLGSNPGPRLVADVGTGSGCVAVSVAFHAPEARLVGGDLSSGALRVARANARRHGVEPRVGFWQGDLLGALKKNAVDLICANLPYIPTSVLRGLPIYGREPILALEGGPDGMDAIRRLLGQAPSRLVAGGALLLEIETSQGEAALSLAGRAFPGARVSLLQDLAGRDRLVAVETRPSQKTV